MYEDDFKFSICWFHENYFQMLWTDFFPCIKIKINLKFYDSAKQDWWVRITESSGIFISLKQIFFLGKQEMHLKYLHKIVCWRKRSLLWGGLFKCAAAPVTENGRCRCGGDGRSDLDEKKSLEESFFHVSFLALHLLQLYLCKMLDFSHFSFLSNKSLCKVSMKLDLYF